MDGAGGLDSAVHFYHSTPPGSPNAWNVTVRNMNVTGTETAIIFWDTTVQNVVIEDSTITGATRFAVRYEIAGTNIVLRRVTSTGSGVQGFYSPSAPTRPASPWRTATCDDNGVGRTASRCDVTWPPSSWGIGGVI